MLDVVVFAVAGAGAAFLLWAGTRDAEANERGWNWKSLTRKSGGTSPSISPVVGTVIMVAITVVLAAVLYVMVAGLRGT